MRLNSDTSVALVLLLICGGIFINTLQMPPAMFNQMPATLWPRLIIVPLALLSFLLLIKAQRTDQKGPKKFQSLTEWFQFYKNPIVCFALFFAFLITMPILGMLIGGLLYVFTTLNFLGGWSPKLMAKHGLLSIFFVVGMWAIFTQLLGVFLPEGILLRVY
jgi:hypothetical protein